MELDKQSHTDAVASLKRYCAENLPEPLGDLPAGMLLDFFLEEIAPVIYNHAISDAQTRLQRSVADLSGDLYEKPFGYWPRLDAKRKTKR